MDLKNVCGLNLKKALIHIMRNFQFQKKLYKYHFKNKWKKQRRITNKEQKNNLNTTN